MSNNDDIPNPCDDDIPNPCDNVPLPGIEMLHQPLMTDDGHFNPMLMEELERKVARMGESYDRLSGEPEWSMPYCTSLNDIVGSFAGTACSHYRRGAPPGLENVTSYLHACLNKDPLFRDATRTEDHIILADMSLCDINQALHEILSDNKLFQDWNNVDIVGETWLDLSALLHQTCILIRNERRHSYAFNKKFERDYRDGKRYDEHDEEIKPGGSDD